MKRIAVALSLLIACISASLAQPVTVIGPITPGDCAAFNSTTVIKDCGTAAANIVSGPASSTDGDVAVFNGTTGKIIKDSGVASSGVDGNVLNAQTSNYSAASTDCGKTITLGGSAFFTLTVGAASGFPATCSIVVANIDGGRGKKLAVSGVTFPNGSILWPLQTFILKNESNVWTAISAPGLWQLQADTTWFVDPVNGNDSNDCLASGSSACLTIQGALNQVCGPIDAMLHKPIIQLADDTTHYTTQINSCDVKGAAPSGFTSVPVLRGNVGSLGNVAISVTSANGFVGVSVNTAWRVEGIEWKTITSGTAITADVDATKIYIGANKFTVGSCCNVFGYQNGGFIEVVNAITINGPANAVLNGAQLGHLVSQPVVWTISGTPAWGFSFANVVTNATASMIGVTFSGSATGSRCNISTGGGIDTNGAGATFFPGNIPCSGGSVVNPGWYN